MCIDLKLGSEGKKEKKVSIGREEEFMGGGGGVGGVRRGRGWVKVQTLHSTVSLKALIRVEERVPCPLADTCLRGKHRYSKSEESRPTGVPGLPAVGGAGGC